MDLIRYGYNGNLLTILKDRYGIPWWLAGEACGVLGYVDTHDAVKMYCRHPRLLKAGEAPVLEIPPKGLLIVNEPDLYRLIVHCHLPAAGPFEAWIFDEVLPTIRKAGACHHTEARRRGRPRKEPEDDYFGDILKEQRQLHQIFEHAYKIAKRMTPSGREASVMAQAKVKELTGIDLAESYHLPPGMKSRAETEKEIIDGFVHDCCVIGDDSQVPATELYQAFRNWFEHNRSGEVPKQKWFGIRMGQRFKRKKDGTYKYRGIDLKKSILTDEGYVRDFIEECCSLGDDLKVSLKVLYERFSELYLKRTGQVPLPIDRFREVLTGHFCLVPDDANVLSGIGLRPVPSAEE